MRKIIAVVCMAALATCAYAEVGSVISSFYLGTSGIHDWWWFGIYRDPSYVYCIHHQLSGVNLYFYTPGGSRQGYVPIYSGTISYYGDSDRCHLGAGYIAWMADGLLIFTNIRRPVPPAGYFAVRSPGVWSTHNVAWGGAYYYVNDYTDRGVFNRYTTTGSLAGTWTVAGWPPALLAHSVAFSRSFNEGSGQYFIAVSADRTYAFNMNGGSLLGSWRIPRATDGQRGAICGDAYPPSYGAALWVHSSFRVSSVLTDSWAYQIDVNARGATSVLPASLGKVKAIYL